MAGSGLQGPSAPRCQGSTPRGTPWHAPRSRCPLSAHTSRAACRPCGAGRTPPSGAPGSSLKPHLEVPLAPVRAPHLPLSSLLMAMSRVMISVISAVGFERLITVFRTSPRRLISPPCTGIAGSGLCTARRSSFAARASSRGSRPRLLLKRWPAGPGSRKRAASSSTQCMISSLSLISTSVDPEAP